jgi:acetyl-CoA synthetase
VAFVTLRDDFEADAHTEKALMQTVSKQIGAFARPASIRFTKSLPKTRSGKIMRRLLRELATQGRVTGDVTTLEDFGAIAALSAEA